MSLKGDFVVNLGKSFHEGESSSFMAMRYDFMPASVDKSRPGSIKIDDGKDVTVTFPSGSSNTTFKGPARPASKECVLVYNKKTGSMTLERISYVSQLKKHRDEQIKRPSQSPEFQSSSPSMKNMNSTKMNSMGEQNKGLENRRPIETMSDSDSDLDIPPRVSNVQMKNNSDMFETRNTLAADLAVSETSSDESDFEGETTQLNNMTINKPSGQSLFQIDHDRNIIENDLKLSESDTDSE